MKLLKATILSVYIWISIPVLAFAQQRSQTTTNILNNLGKTAKNPFGAEDSGVSSVSVTSLIGNLVQVVLGFTGTVTFLVFLYGGFLWLSARGNDDQVATAKKYITNGLIGTILVIAAFSISIFLTSTVFKAVSG